MKNQFLAQVFVFTESNMGCIVGVLYLKEHKVAESRYESAHKEYTHVGIDDATVFPNREAAEDAIRIDTCGGELNGWTRWHDSTYWPLVKTVLAENGLWGRAVRFTRKVLPS